MQVGHNILLIFCFLLILERGSILREKKNLARKSTFGIISLQLCTFREKQKVTPGSWLHFCFSAEVDNYKGKIRKIEYRGTLLLFFRFSENRSALKDEAFLFATTVQSFKNCTIYTCLVWGAVNWIQQVLFLPCRHLVLRFLASMPCMIHFLFLHTNRTGNHNQYNPDHVHDGRLLYTQCRDHPCHRCCIYKNADNGVHNLFLCRCTIGH